MKAIIDRWSLIDPVCEFEQTIAAGLIDDSMDVVQRCRAAGITADDFSFEPFAPVARAAFEAVDLPEWDSVNYYRRIDVIAKLATLYSDRRVWSVDDMLSLGMPTARQVSFAIARLVSVSRPIRVARQHFAAAHRSMLAAFRAATEDRHDVQPLPVLARRDGNVARPSRDVPAARDVRTVGSLPRLAGRPYPPGSEVERRAERVGREVHPVGHRRAV